MNLTDVGWEVVDWTRPAQYMGKWRTVVNAVMDRRVPYNLGRLLAN
jgi:hypothetical protein